MRVKYVREWHAGQVEVVEGAVGWDGTGGLCTAEGAKPAAVSSLLHFECDPNTNHHQILERNGAASSWTLGEVQARAGGQAVQDGSGLGI